MIFGGVPHGAQIRALAQGSTCWWRRPAACRSSRRPRANLSDVEFFVLDEVDQMLDLGFLRQIRRIVRDPGEAAEPVLLRDHAAGNSRLANELLHDPSKSR